MMHICASKTPSLQKILIFPIDLNDFMQLWGELVATLLALGGRLRVTCLGYMRVTLDNFGPVLDHIDVEWHV